jgi:hypothetical protein
LGVQRKRHRSSKFGVIVNTYMEGFGFGFGFGNFGGVSEKET